MSRIGLLGGTFNPPHLGHLKLAAIALDQLELDSVWFLPNADPPHKAGVGPSGRDRLRLLEAALAGCGRRFQVEPLEVERGGLSYTVTTLEALRQRHPEHSFIFIMGSDQLPCFPGWKQPERILTLAALAVAARPGVDPAPLPELLAGRERPCWSGRPGELIHLPGTELDLASRDLRAGLGRGERPAGIPPEVMAAVLRENQYR